MVNETELISSADRVYLLPRSPSAFFVSWSWSLSTNEAFRAGSYGPEIFVRLSASDDKGLFAEAGVCWDSGKLYIKPPAEGRTFSVSVYGLKQDGSREIIMESNSVAAPVSAPRNGPSYGYSSAEFFRKDPV